MNPVTDLQRLHAAQAKVRALETKSTPLEFLEAERAAAAAGDALFVDQLADSHSAKNLRGATSVSELRLDVEMKFARLYVRPGTRRRRLLVGFTGAARRMMMPLPIFMQALPPEADLLLLLDMQNSHYRTGIWDGTCDLTNLPRTAAPLTSAYEDVIALGTSSGALPAVRFAKMAGLRRGLSFGGRAINDTLRLLRGDRSAPAYDPLCACDARNRTDAIYCFAALHPQDTLSALQAAECANAHLVPLWGRNDHSVLWTIATMGRLNDLLTLAFEGSPEDLIRDVGAWNAEDLAVA